MAKYIVLMNLTEQGIKDIKSAPDRVKAQERALEAAGSKLLEFYLTMGPYDYVAITEGPGDEVAMTQLLALGAGGNVRTTTLKAFTLDEFEGMLKNLP